MMITEQALTDMAVALTNIATSIEGIAVALQGIDSAGVEHRHTWVFLRDQQTIRKVTPEIKEKYGRGIIKPDTMIEVHGLYYCSGCPALRRVHMEDLLESPHSIDGRPYTRIWQVEIPE